MRSPVAKVVVDSTHGYKAVPFAMQMLAQLTRRRKLINVPVVAQTYEMAGNSIFVKSCFNGDLIIINYTENPPFDLLFYELLPGKKVVVYGYDLLKMSISKIREVSAADLVGYKSTDVQSPDYMVPIIDPSIISDSALSFSLRPSFNKICDLYCSDRRDIINNQPRLNYFRGRIGEGKIRKKEYVPKSLKFDPFPDVPGVVYPHDDSIYPENKLWPSPALPPHLSLQKHITKSGYEYAYCCETWDDVTVRARWFFRDLSVGGKFSLLYDLSFPQRYYDVYVHYGEGGTIIPVDLLLPPTNFDTIDFVACADNIIYMRLLIESYVQSIGPMSRLSHEWWVVKRDRFEDEEGNVTFGEWTFSPDGVWSGIRELTPEGQPVDIFDFFGLIFDNYERYVGYIENRRGSADCSMIFTYMGMSLGSPLFSLPFNYTTEFGIDPTLLDRSNYVDVSIDIWTLDEPFTFCFLIRMSHTSEAHIHPTDKDLIAVWQNGVFDVVYETSSTRKLTGITSSTGVSRNGQYYLGGESARFNPDPATNDIILIDVKSKIVKNLNRAACYEPYWGKQIAFPFAIVEPTRTLI